MAGSVRLKKLLLFAVNSVIIIVTVCGMAAACIFSVAKDITVSKTFAEGVSVNGIVLAGMTYDEAAALLAAEEAAALSSEVISLSYLGRTYTFSAAEMGMTYDTKQVLDAAFAVGKNTGSVSEAYNAAHQENALATQLSVDISCITAKLASIAAEADVDPVDAKATFNAARSKFTYVAGKDGTVLNVDDSAQLILNGLLTGERSFRLYSDGVGETLTVSTLKSVTKELAEFSTQTSANFNRNTNIALMCKYMNGAVIMPGEVLSVNETVGERTAEKGFLAAAVIADGKRLENELGGGICQFAGTLFNAALMANLDIVERYPHSWPSDYVPVGLDSTLDWNSDKDLKLANRSPYPVYITAWMEGSDYSSKNEVHVRIFGAPLPDGMTMQLRVDTIEVIEPVPASVKYVSWLSPGETRTAVKQRTGYRVKLWKDFYLDGKLVDSEFVCDSYYRAIRGEVYIGEQKEDIIIANEPIDIQP